jgi:hypothetical protein
VAHVIGEQSSATGSVSYRRRTDGFVWNDLNALDVASRLENLTQHIFSYSGVQSSHVEGSLVRFGRGATGHVAWSAARRHHGVVVPRVAGQGRAHGGWDGIVVLGDHHGRERRRRHVLLLPALVAIVTRGAAGRRGEVTPRLLLVGHVVRRGASQTAKVCGSEKRSLWVPRGDAERRRRHGHANGWAGARQAARKVVRRESKTPARKERKEKQEERARRCEDTQRTDAEQRKAEMAWVLCGVRRRGAKGERELAQAPRRMHGGPVVSWKPP